MPRDMREDDNGAGVGLDLVGQDHDHDAPEFASDESGIVNSRVLLSRVDTTLLLLARAGESGSALTKLLEKGADPFKCDSRGDSALLTVVRNHNYAAAAQLFQHFNLAHEAQIREALDIAVKQDDFDMVLLFAKHGVVTEAKNAKGRSLWTHAVAYQDLGLIRKVFKPNFSSPEIEYEKLIAFLLAVHLNHEDCLDAIFETVGRLGKESLRLALQVAFDSKNNALVKYLIKHGATIDFPDEDGKTFLTKRAAVGDLEGVKMLVEAYDANVDTMDSENKTPLEHAARGGHIAVCDYLLGKGAFIFYSEEENIANECQWDHNIVGYSALMKGAEEMISAVKAGNVQQFSYWIQNGMTPRIIINRDVTLLALAIKHGHLTMVREILKYKMDLNTDHIRGYSPLMLAAQYGYADIVSELIKHGANVYHRDNQGNSALHMAAMSGHDACVECILSHDNSSKHAANAEGITPLMLAAYNGHNDCVKALIASGVNTEVKDTHKNTALMYAAEKNHSKCMQYLLKANARSINAPDHEGVTLLQRMAQMGNTEGLNFLLAHGANVNKAEPAIGRTALHYAACSGHEDACRLLLSKGAYPNIKTGGGTSPKKMARSSGYATVSNIIRNHQIKKPLIWSSAGIAAAGTSTFMGLTGAGVVKIGAGLLLATGPALPYAIGALFALLTLYCAYKAVKAVVHSFRSTVPHDTNTHQSGQPSRQSDDGASLRR